MKTTKISEKKVLSSLGQTCNVGSGVIKPGLGISLLTFRLDPCDYVSITHLAFICQVDLQGDIVKDICEDKTGVAIF